MTEGWQLFLNQEQNRQCTYLCCSAICQIGHSSLELQSHTGVYTKRDSPGLSVALGRVHSWQAVVPSRLCSQQERRMSWRSMPSCKENEDRTAPRLARLWSQPCWSGSVCWVEVAAPSSGRTCRAHEWSYLPLCVSLLSLKLFLTITIGNALLIDKCYLWCNCWNLACEFDSPIPEWDRPSVQWWRFCW